MSGDGERRVEIDAVGLLVETATAMREQHGDNHPRHAMWAVIADHLDDIAERHGADPDPVELVLHMDEDCPTGECVDPGYHEGCIVCRGCYPSWEGMDGHTLFPCPEFKAALNIAQAYTGATS